MIALWMLFRPWKEELALNVHVFLTVDVLQEQAANASPEVSEDNTQQVYACLICLHQATKPHASPTAVVLVVLMESAL